MYYYIAYQLKEINVHSFMGPSQYFFHKFMNLKYRYVFVLVWIAEYNAFEQQVDL